MSTSLLYHAFGIVGHHSVSQHFQQGPVNFWIEPPRQRLRCPQGGGDATAGSADTQNAPSAPSPLAPSLPR